MDIHVHFREPGQTHKEDIRTGTQAAAAGGFTTCVCMPNTSPVCDNAGTILLIQDSISRNAIVNVLPTGCITLGMAGETPSPNELSKECRSHRDHRRWEVRSRQPAHAEGTGVLSYV